MRRKALADQVAVVMGASTGIGRLTAHELAKRGAKVVVAARGQESLDELVSEIREYGGHAIAMAADTTDPQQVRAVADRAVSELGGLDTWVQAAALSVYGPLDATPADEFKQVVDVTLLGQAYGAMAAIPIMKRLGGGAFIAVSSVESEVAMPLHAAYTAAKHGLNGMLDALRLELKKERAPVSVTAIMPASIDTPFFDHSRTRMGVAPRPMPPVYDPQKVAHAIVNAAVHPRRTVIVGGSGQMMVRMHRHFPRLVDALLGRSAFRLQKSRKLKSAAASDNLNGPVEGDTRVRGTEAEEATRRLRRRRVGKRIALGSLVGLGALVWMSRAARR